MRVNILFSAIGDYMPKYHTPGENPLRSLTDEIARKAKDAWNARLPNAKTVNFLQKMPAKYGQHFRFFEVTQKDENTLLVSTRNAQ